jgi:hypothetical protein
MFTEIPASSGPFYRDTSILIPSSTEIPASSTLIHQKYQHPLSFNLLVPYLPAISVSSLTHPTKQHPHLSLIYKIPASSHPHHRRYQPPHTLITRDPAFSHPHHKRYQPPHTLITRDTSLRTTSSITDPNLLTPLVIRETSHLIPHPPNTRHLIPSSITYSIPDSSALSTTVLDSSLFRPQRYHPHNHQKYVPASSSLIHQDTNQPTHLLIHHRNQTYSSSMILLSIHVPQIPASSLARLPRYKSHHPLIHHRYLAFSYPDPL